MLEIDQRGASELHDAERLGLKLRAGYRVREFIRCGRRGDGGSPFHVKLEILVLQMVAYAVQVGGVRLGAATEVFIEEILGEPEQAAQRPVLVIDKSLTQGAGFRVVSLLRIMPEAPERYLRRFDAERKVLVQEETNLVEQRIRQPERRSHLFHGEGIGRIIQRVVKKHAPVGGAGEIRVLHISDMHLNPSAWSVVE